MAGMTPSARSKRARRSTSRVAMVAAVLVAALSYSAVNQAQVAGGKPRPSKLDRVLQKAAAAGDGSEQRVILRARAGRAADVADRLTRHGDKVAAKHERFSSITAIVHARDLRALEADADVEAVSIDAVIGADGAPSAGDELESATEDTLVATLGLSDTRYDGERVGIAIIDSGLEMSEDLSGGRG